MVRNLKFTGRITDVRGLDLKVKKNILELWIKLHVLTCSKNNLQGHQWKKHYFDTKIKAWIGSCSKCDEIRVTTARCDDLRITKHTKCLVEFTALVVTDDFVNNIDCWHHDKVEDELIRKIKHVLQINNLGFLGEKDGNEF